jgi:membrane protein implicated in regulation of membrane protease activity
MMRRGRIYFKLGVLLFMLLAGAAFFLLVPVSSEVAVVAVEAPVEAIGVGLEAFPWVIFAVVGVIIVLAVMRTFQRSQSRDVRKRKHDDEVAPYLDEMIEQGVVRLEDDGELPELAEDDLYTGDKPKRSEDDA